MIRHILSDLPPRERQIVDILYERGPSVVTEICGTVPGRALYVLDKAYDEPSAYEDWLAATTPVVRALLDRTRHD